MSSYAEDVISTLLCLYDLFFLFFLLLFRVFEWNSFYWVFLFYIYFSVAGGGKALEKDFVSILIELTNIIYFLI